MCAIKKMEGYGILAISEAVRRSPSIVYRWRKALVEGRGISDKNKRALIRVTAGSKWAIDWADFAPMLEAA